MSFNWNWNWKAIRHRHRVVCEVLGVRCVTPRRWQDVVRFGAKYDGAGMDWLLFGASALGPFARTSGKIVILQTRRAL